jgi:hypothetical protein
MPYSVAAARPTGQRGACQVSVAGAAGTGPDLNRHVSRSICSAGLALALVIAAGAAAGPASAVATTTVGLWSMNEPPGAGTATDSSGNGQHGTVGSDVQTGVPYAGAIAYRFPDIAPNAPPARPQHLVTVPHSPLLNPGSGDFTVTVRFRTTRTPSNIVQKGQSGTSGGYWKFEQDNGQVKCLFRGGNLQQRSAYSIRRIDDGLWHTVTCERTSTSVTMYVDGVRHSTQNGPTGSISNTWPLAIGGKSSCNQYKVGCDYFSGDIDYVRIRKN